MGIGTEIKERREERALSQGELARMVGLQQSLISKWESGSCTPNVRSLAVLSTVLGPFVVDENTNEAVDGPGL